MRRPTPAAACLLAVTAVAGAAGPAFSAPPEAFGPPLAELDLDLDALGATPVGGLVAIPFLDDETLTVRVTRLHGSDQNLRVAGDVVGADPPGRFNLIVRRDAVNGRVQLPSLGVYRLHGTVGEAATLHEVDLSALPPCAVGPEHAAGGFGGGGGMALGGPPCDDGSTIDVMVMYTPNARSSIGGVNAMEAQIDMAIELANEAYDNSQIPVQLSLVHTGEVDYLETSSYSGHLGHLTDPDDNVMDEVHALRDQFGADMVALLVNDGAACGVAWLMTNNPPGFEDMAFSVTSWFCISGHTFTHELGHNMGCCHAVGDGGGCFSGGLFSYSVGWRFDGVGGPLWRTVMAYSPGTRIPHFSDPAIEFDGVPTGVPIGDPNEAENAFTVRQTHPAIAEFRCSIPPCVEGLLTASDAEEQDSFGQTVALDGGVAVVGSPGEDDNGLGAGAAYVYRDNGTNAWSEEAKLTASDASAGDAFGRDAAISGDVIVIGAPDDDGSGADSGSAYVYRHDGSMWVEEAKLTADDAAAGARFGESVAIDGDVIVVGAEADGPEDAGAAYVFRHDGAMWAQEQKLLGDGAADDAFGSDVAVSGDAILVGAHGHDEAAPNAGSAYVFRYDGLGWAQEAELVPGDLGADDSFGGAVGLDGTRALVGAHRHDAGAEDTGAVYPYAYDGSSWLEQPKLQEAVTQQGTAFGRDLDLDGTVAIIGAYGADDFGVDSGAVYVFRTDGTWSQVARLTASRPDASDRFGFGVAIDGPNAIAGAVSGDAVALGAGSAEIFPGPVFDCNGNGLSDACDIFYEPVLDGDGDGVIDECACEGDLDGDGQVSTSDLLNLLAAWGSNPGGPPDLDGDGTVGTTDLLILLGNWGTCS